MFFASPGTYKACGLFTSGHLFLTLITISSIIILLKFTNEKQNIKRIIKACTIFLWIFEFIIIGFKIFTGGLENINNYVPLYYCSILLYAGLLSSFAGGKLKRIGDVFLATGGIVGGVLYLIYPITSIATYPIFHLVSVHSFIFHGIMIYLGMLINLTNYIKLERKDIKYYFFIISVVAFVSYIVNQIFDSNLMFISKNFPGNIVINTLYNASGKYFPLIMVLGQATLPFYIVYGFRKFKNENISINEKSNEFVLCNVNK